MEIIHTMFMSKVLTNSWIIKQKIKIKNIFANVICNVLLVKKY